MLADGVLARTPDINDNFITGTEAVIGRSGEIDTGFKCQVTGIEDVTSKDLITTGKVLSGGMVVQHIGSIFLCFFTQAGFVDVRAR